MEIKNDKNYYIYVIKELWWKKNTTVVEKEICIGIGKTHLLWRRAHGRDLAENIK